MVRQACSLLESTPRKIQIRTPHRYLGQHPFVDRLPFSVLGESRDDSTSHHHLRPKTSLRRRNDSADPGRAIAQCGGEWSVFQKLRVCREWRNVGAGHPGPGGVGGGAAVSQTMSPATTEFWDGGSIFGLRKSPARGGAP